MRPFTETPRGPSCSHTECRNRTAPGVMLCEEHRKKYRKSASRVPARYTCRWCSYKLPERTPDVDAFCSEACESIYETQQHLQPGDINFISRNARERAEHIRLRSERNK